MGYERFAARFDWASTASGHDASDEARKEIARQLAAAPGRNGGRGDRIVSDSKEVMTLAAVIEALDTDRLLEIADVFVIQHNTEEDAAGVDVQVLLDIRFTKQMRRIKKVVPPKDDLMAVQVKPSSVKFDEFWRTKMDRTRWKQLNMICLEGQWPSDLILADFAIQFIALHHGLRHPDRGGQIFALMSEPMRQAVMDNVHLVAQYHGQFLGWLVGDGNGRWCKDGAIEEAIGLAC